MFCYIDQPAAEQCQQFWARSRTLKITHILSHTQFHPVACCKLVWLFQSLQVQGQQRNVSQYLVLQKEDEESVFPFTSYSLDTIFMLIKTLKGSEKTSYFRPREDIHHTCDILYRLSGSLIGASAPEMCLVEKKVEMQLWDLSSSVFSEPFTWYFLNPGLTLSNSVQLEMPYLVCPNGLIRVLSDTPPPCLTAPEVRASPPPPEHLLPTRQPAALPPSLPSIHCPSGLLWTSELLQPNN